MKFDLKKFLKKLKLNEDKISMVLGIIVVLIVGNFVVNYIRAKKVDSLPAINTEKSSESMYKVARGESLWTIAEKEYGDGYKWQEIAKANELDNYSLEIDQELTLPELESTNDESLAANYAQEGDTISSESYTVVQGDTLWNIAVRTYGDGYQWVKIAKANNLVNPNVIHAGNVLTLPR